LSLDIGELVKPSLPTVGLFFGSLLQVDWLTGITPIEIVNDSLQLPGIRKLILWKDDGNPC
jgi:hypothetical protein